MSRKDLRSSALNEFLMMGESARASAQVPDAYAIAHRLGLASQTMAERLRATRRLQRRLAFLVPPYEAQAETAGEDGLPPFPVDAGDAPDTGNTFQQAAPSNPAHPLAGDMLMQVASKIAGAVECLNLGAMLGKDELRGLAREFGETAMRFGLKFRSAVPIWMLEAVRGGDGGALQVAATALLVWSEVEDKPFTDELSQGLASLRPIPVQTLDDPQETVELVRLALTASRN